MNGWQLIFLQSKMNNNTYYGELLPSQNWDWPVETWFQKRLRHLRGGENRHISQLNPKVSRSMLEVWN